MKKLISAAAIAIAVSMVTPTDALASAPTAGTLVRLFVDQYGFAFVELDTAISGQPTCAANTPQKMGFDVRTDTGKAMYSFVLAAYLAGKKVTIRGSNDCPTNSTYEDLEYIWISPSL